MNQDLTGAFAGRRVLVTGHTGFKGSWLVQWLTALGAEVVGASLAPEDGSLFSAARLGTDMDSRVVDVRDAAAVRSALQDARPDFVFHLAAQSLVRQSYAEPVTTFATNVLGTVHVLDAVRHVGSVRGVLVVTSDKCYENNAWPWSYREIDPVGGHDPYSASKGCAELVTAAYRRSFFDREDSAVVATARAGNVIGGGDWAVDRLVPDLVRGAVSHQVTHVRSPAATRPWQHVLDALAGYLLLGARLMRGERELGAAWNFGPLDGEVRSVARLVARATCQWDAIQVTCPEAGAEVPHEAATLRIDSGKARSALAWSSAFTFDQAVDAAVGWYRDFCVGGSSARALMERDIATYPWGPA